MGSHGIYAVEWQQKSFGQVEILLAHGADATIVSLQARF